MFSNLEGGCAGRQARLTRSLRTRPRLSYHSGDGGEGVPFEPVVD